MLHFSSSKTNFSQQMQMRFKIIAFSGRSRQGCSTVAAEPRTNPAQGGAGQDRQCPEGFISPSTEQGDQVRSLMVTRASQDSH